MGATASAGASKPGLQPLRQSVCALTTMPPVLLPLPLGEGGGEGQRRWHAAHALLRNQSAKNTLNAWILLWLKELLAQAAPGLEALFVQ